MNNREQVNEEATIDLRALFSAIWDKIVIIILAGVALACVAFLGTKLLITPTYDSTTKIYVVNSQTDSAITYSDVQLGKPADKGLHGTGEEPAGSRGCHRRTGT